jgi:hypothetical protein
LQGTGADMGRNREGPSETLVSEGIQRKTFTLPVASPKAAIVRSDCLSAKVPARPFVPARHKDMLSTQYNRRVRMQAPVRWACFTDQTRACPSVRVMCCRREIFAECATFHASGSNQARGISQNLRESASPRLQSSKELRTKNRFATRFCGLARQRQPDNAIFPSGGLAGQSGQHPTSCNKYRCQTGRRRCNKGANSTELQC